MRVGEGGPGSREGAVGGRGTTKGKKKITGVRITGRESWENQVVVRESIVHLYNGI